MTIPISLAITFLLGASLSWAQISSPTPGERPFTSFATFNKRLFNPREPDPVEERCIPSRKERTFSGFCNNLGKPDYGKTQTPFIIRSTVIDYDVTRLPNPRVISNIVNRELTTPPNRRRMSELVTFMGQFIDHTVTETENSRDPWNIVIPADDPVFNFTSRGEIKFFRTVKLPQGKYRSPINLLSAFLDLDSIYGHSKEGAAGLRLMKDGLLKELPGNILTKNAMGFFISGDRRVNENPILTAIHTLFNREHNSIAKQVKKAYPNESDEFIFQVARKANIAEFQAIVYYEFLPAVLGRPLPNYFARGYQSNVNAGITNEFSTVAFRVGHTMINPKMTSIDNSGKVSKIDLRDAFFQPTTFEKIGMDAILRGVIKTKAAEVDAGVTTDVRDFLINDGRAMLDLVALNIQRGRDHGVPRYNELRRAFNLPVVRSFAEITKNKEVQEKLKQAFGTVSNIEPWVGGVAEDHVSGGSLGPLFRAIWIHQFEALRHGDRFYFEQRNQFPLNQIARIPILRSLYWGSKRGTMRRVLLRNTGLKSWQVQRDPFFA